MGLGGPHIHPNAQVQANQYVHADADPHANADADPHANGDADPHANAAPDIPVRIVRSSVGRLCGRSRPSDH